MIRCVFVFFLSTLLDGGNMNEFFISLRFRQKPEDTHSTCTVKRKKNGMVKTDEKNERNESKRNRNSFFIKLHLFRCHCCCRCTQCAADARYVHIFFDFVFVSIAPMLSLWRQFLSLSLSLSLFYSRSVQVIIIRIFGCTLQWIIIQFPSN